MRTHRTRTPSNTAYKSPLTSGFFGGVLAYLAGFVIIDYFVKLGETASFAVEITQRQVSLWYFYGAHYVGIAETASAGGQSGRLSNDINLIAQTGDPHFQFLPIVPAAILFVLGVLICVHRGHTNTASYAVLNGAHVTAGYLPAALVGAYISAETRSGFGVTARLGPAYVDSILFAGILFPVIFGGLGGVAYYVARTL